MADDSPDDKQRRKRFPLRLDDTVAAPRRLVDPQRVGSRREEPAVWRRSPAQAPGPTASAPPVPVPPPVSSMVPLAAPVPAPWLAPPPVASQPPAAPPTASPQASARRSGPPPFPAPIAEGASARARMVERLRLAGCRDELVLRAIGHVPRHRFVDAGLFAQAYEDTSLPIGLGQTISKPSVVARMLELLRARPGGPDLGRVLEIGTGCGYQAALLVLLARDVFSVERLRGLYDRSRENLADSRPSHLRLVFGDGRLGHPPNAPYDGIVAAASGQAVPPAWLEQLAPGGRLVAPVLDTHGGGQVLLAVDRRLDGSFVQTRHEAVRFVPLESGISDLGIL
jgi:protein-L-isoaspartate(D-aspartate) O-methyltransferase